MSLKDREDGFFTPASLVQVLGLVLSVLIIGILYSLIIRPNAEKYLLAEAYGVTTQATERGNLYVIMMDYEQQACMTLMLWMLFILAYKAWLVHNEKSLLLREESAMHDHANKNSMIIYKKGKVHRAEAHAMNLHLENHLQKNPELYDKLLPHLLLKGLHRFIYAGSIQEAAEAVKAHIDVTADRLDSELSIIRYIAWAIPSIGFIGTVRGIGAALENADLALEGDISGVTTSLGLAFNSTLVALFISIFLMFFIHTLQARQEGTILALETFCRDHFIDRLRIEQTSQSDVVQTLQALPAPSQPATPNNAENGTQETE